MQISSFTDYSIRVLIYLATLEPHELTKISYVSDLYGISKNHTVKIVHKLGQLGYIDTIQGKNGGIRLNRPAKDIIVGELFRKLEPLQLLNCESSFCHISPACRLKSHLARAKDAFLNELDQCSIQDMLTDNDEIKALLSEK